MINYNTVIKENSLEKLNKYVSITKRIEPSITNSYIVTINILDNDKAFKTRLFTRYQNIFIYAGEVVVSRFLRKKKKSIEVFIKHPYFHKISNVLDIPKNKFNSVMSFGYNKQEDMDEVAIQLEKLIYQLVQSEYEDYEKALNTSKDLESVVPIK